jgi:hypothetical protein
MLVMILDVRHCSRYMLVMILDMLVIVLDMLVIVLDMLVMVLYTCWSQCWMLAIVLDHVSYCSRC